MYIQCEHLHLYLVGSIFPPFENNTTLIKVGAVSLIPCCVWDDTSYCTVACCASIVPIRAQAVYLECSLESVECLCVLQLVVMEYVLVCQAVFVCVLPT